MKTRKKDFLMALAAAAVLFPSVSFAGPKKDGPAPVAEGYPAWTGITSQNYICGRVLLSGSDLRQKITVVVEIDASKPVEQVTLTSGMPRLNGYSDSIWGGGQSWETFELPRDVMVVYVARNVKRHETLVSALTSADYKTNATVGDLMNGKVPVYENVTFEGAPDNGGKLPFVYVMGMEGKTPLVKEPVGPATLGAVRAAIASERAKVAGCAWRPFYGYVQEPKHFKEIEATLAKGKPLEAYEGLMLKGIASPEPEIAKEDADAL